MLKYIGRVSSVVGEVNDVCVCVAHMVKGSTQYYSIRATSASFCLSCYILQLIGLFGAIIPLK